MTSGHPLILFLIKIVMASAIYFYPQITADGVFRRAVLTAFTQMLLLSQ